MGDLPGPQELEVHETFEITGRGTVYIVTAPKDSIYAVGTRVLKDGVLHEVTGVEMRPTATPQYVFHTPDGPRQGILIREIPE